MKFRWALGLVLCVGCSSESDPVDAGFVDMGPVADAGPADMGGPADAGPTDMGNPNNFSLTVRVEGSGQGQVQDTANGVDCTTAQSPCTYSLQIGTQLNLTTIAGANSGFDSWADAVCATVGQPTCTFDVQSNVPVTVIALFTD